MTLDEKRELNKYRKILKVLQSAKNIASSQLSFESKYELLNALGCDYSHYGQISERSYQLVRATNKVYLERLEEEIDSFTKAIEYLKNR